MRQQLGAAPSRAADEVIKSYVDGLLSGAGGGLTPTAVITADYTASVGDLVVYDNAAGAFTITLPAAPKDGAMIAALCWLSPSTNYANLVTLQCGGTDTMPGLGASIGVLGMSGLQYTQVFYSADQKGWYLSDGFFSINNFLALDSIIPVSSLNTAGTASASTYLRGDGSWQGVPYDLSLMGFGAATARAVGTGDNPMGIRLARACTLTSVTFRCHTADNSGSLVVQLNRNGSVLSGTSTTIPVANQVGGNTSAGTWSCNAGDIITIYITGVGTTPGMGLIADITGTA